MSDVDHRCDPEQLTAAEREVVDAALTARDRAHAPYSRFRVGAAVRSADGRIQPGCNVENASYGLTLCAERVALFAAVAAGHRATVTIAVVGPGFEGRPTPPCGACRQVMMELAPEASVLLATPEGTIERWTTTELLPRAFLPFRLPLPTDPDADGENE